MNLVYPLFPEPLSFNENTVNVVIIENPVELRKAIVTLQQQIEGSAGEFVLSEDFVPIELSKYAALVVNPFDLALESKRITSKLSRMACEVGTDFTEAFYRISGEINALAAQIGMNMDFEVSFTPLEDMERLIDLLKFHIDRDELSFPEQILVYMKLYRNFFGIRLFAFYNLKACVSPEELTLLYRAICYEKLNVLLLEDVQRGQALPEEKTMLIDKDLCVL